MVSLPWRADAAFLKAWPALSTTTHHDWQARFAHGLSRRSNSVNPLSADAALNDADVQFFENLYRAQNLPLIFRVPVLLDTDVDLVLSRSGFGREGECFVLHGALDGVATTPDTAVVIHAAPTREWFDAAHVMQARAPEHCPTYEAIVKAIALPAGFATLRDDGEPVALAYGVLDGDLLCIESVVTSAAHRGKGHAKRLMGALLHWAKANGAAIACLQVEAANDAALALYRRTGLDVELYRYHYRRQPAHAANLRPGDA